MLQLSESLKKRADWATHQDLHLHWHPGLGLPNSHCRLNVFFVYLLLLNLALLLL